MKHAEDTPYKVVTWYPIDDHLCCLVPQHEAALREIVELRRRLNEFQANALTQNHLHSVSALEMKTKVSEALICLLYVCVDDIAGGES